MEFNIARPLLFGEYLKPFAMNRNRCFIVLTRVLLALFLCTWAACVGSRTWTDNTGGFSIEADLQEVRPHSVILRLPDGKTREVPIARLSARDKQYVSEHQQTLTIDANSAPSYVRDFYREAFAKDTFGTPGFLTFARVCARIVPDPYKPMWAFPVLIYLSLPFLILGAIWLLISTFKDSRKKGAALIFLNLLSGIFMPLELLKWVFLFYLLSSNWYHFSAPVLFHGFGFLLFISGFLLAFGSLIPTA